MMTPRELALKIAWANYGRPYRWAGDDPLLGYDCSGFVIEVLRSVGLLQEGDWTAASLYALFPHCAVPGPATLVYWAGSQGIRHVEICLDDLFSIGASGGGSSTTDATQAAEHNAYVKVRPIEGRGIIAGYNDPFV